MANRTACIQYRDSKCLSSQHHQGLKKRNATYRATNVCMDDEELRYSSDTIFVRMLLERPGSLGFLDGVQPQLPDSSGVGRMRIGSIPSDHTHRHRMFGIVLDP